jgi:hypothetical protein
MNHIDWCHKSFNLGVNQCRALDTKEKIKACIKLERDELKQCIKPVVINKNKLNIGQFYPSPASIYNPDSLDKKV